MPDNFFNFEKAWVSKMLEEDKKARKKEEERILAILGLTRKDFGAFKNCRHEYNRIIVTALIGGVKRNKYKKVYKKLSEYHIYNSIIEEIHNTEIATITFLLPA